MNIFHIAHVEIGPSPIQAESKFSLAGPRRRKDNPRKWLGFPWITLSELSPFKSLRGPPGSENIFGSSLAVQRRRAAVAYAPARARNAELLVGAASSDVAEVIHHPHYSDDFEFCQLIVSLKR
jgi:hypothetical protein